MRRFVLALALFAACTDAPKPAPAPAPAPKPSPSPTAKARPAPALDAGPFPDPTVEWVVDATPPADGIDRARLLAVFDDAFFSTHDLVEIYGLPEGSDGEAMVPVRAAGAPARYQRIAFGARLIAPFSVTSARVSSREYLDPLAADLRARAATLGLAIRPRKSADEAAVEAQRLRDLYKATSIQLITVVTAPPAKPFEPRRVLAALDALGLKPAPDGSYRAPAFKATTTTPPGRLTEDARPLGDVVFSSYLPPVRDPLRAFDDLLRAAATLRHRLAAQPLELRLKKPGENAAMTPTAARARVAQMQKEMIAGGFPPGLPSTKRLFQLP